MFDPARLAEYASLLEQYAELLRAANRPDELAKVKSTVEAIRAKQNELQLIQQQQQAEQSIQQGVQQQQAAPQ
jgi:hypothetical protein